MKMLSDDDLDLRDMDEEERAKAWDLWFDLAQVSNDRDPPYSHGVFVLLTAEELRGRGAAAPSSGVAPPTA